MTVRSVGSPRTSLSRRSRRLVGIAMTLPAFLLAALLALPGAATAGVAPTTDISVDMVDDPDPVAAGAIVTFSIRVTNNGSATATGVTANFSTDSNATINDVRLFNTEEGDVCSTEVSSVFCDLGQIEGQPSSVSAFSPPLASNEEGIEIDVIAPSEPSGGGGFAALAPFTFASSVSVDSTNQPLEGPDNDSDFETTTVADGSNDSDAGPIPPGGELSTVQGTPSNPVSPGDPFAIALTNVSNQTLVGSIQEEDCDGTQTGDPLCNKPRLGGKAGDYRFSPAASGIRIMLAPAAAPVVVAKAYYDRTLVVQADGVRIFYQKAFGDPVIRLRRCDDARRTECFRVKKLASGDQIVRVPLKDDPRFTRG